MIEILTVKIFEEPRDVVEVKIELPMYRLRLGDAEYGKDHTYHRVQRLPNGQLEHTRLRLRRDFNESHWSYEFKLDPTFEFKLTHGSLITGLGTYCVTSREKWLEVYLQFMSDVNKGSS